MNYIHHLGCQFKMYGMCIFTALVTYTAGYFCGIGSGELLVINEYRLLGFVTYSATYIFFGAFLNHYHDQSNSE